MRRFGRFLLILAGAMAAFRFIPGLARLWQGGVALPLLKTLHRLSAPLPFPVLEPLALIAALGCLGRRTRALTLALMLGAYGCLWYPGYFAAPAGARAIPEDLEPLCAALADRLNAADLRFEPPFDSAGAAAGLDWARVKPVRYPEWMRALDISGLFVPWTGEALVDSGAPAGDLPFTCVHELMHLRGVADEGAANIAAYRACVEWGGMYADSARLWALRCGLSRLDPEARGRALRRVKPSLRNLLACSEPREAPPMARLLGIDEATSDYDALLWWIARNRSAENNMP